MILDETLTAAHVNISSVYRDLGQRKRAFESLMKALELDPEDSDAKDNLA